MGNSAIRFAVSAESSSKYTGVESSCVTFSGSSSAIVFVFLVRDSLSRGTAVL